MKISNSNLIVKHEFEQHTINIIPKTNIIICPHYHCYYHFLCPLFVLFLPQTIFFPQLDVDGMGSRHQKCTLFILLPHVTSPTLLIFELGVGHP